MDKVEKNLSCWAIGFICLLYLFCSGIPFKILSNPESDSLVMPYSYALSCNDINFTGNYTESDHNGAKWLINQNNQFYTDYAGFLLVYSYMHNYMVPCNNLGNKPLVGEYVFIPDWSTRNGVFSYGEYPGRRWVEPYDDMLTGCVVVWNEGNTFIYERIE